MPLCPAALAEPVSIELVFAVDTSSSVDTTEYTLQMRGIATALASDDIIEAIGLHKDGVALAVLQWSGGAGGNGSNIHSRCWIIHLDIA